MVKILFVGGGSGGHITPNLAVIDELINQRILTLEEILYVGTDKGMERDILFQARIPFHAISAGKLRRYFDWENFLDFFRVFIGIFQSFWLIRRTKPRVVFSKGGFIALPIAVGAWLNRVPVITHESDIVSGLANSMIKKIAQKVCLTFPKDRYDEKEILTGLPIRKSMCNGNREKGLALLNFPEKEKPVLLVMGGGQGSRALNEFVWKHLFTLTKRFNIVHLVGKGNTKDFQKEQSRYSPCSWDEVQKNLKNYRSFEYISEELPDIYAAADLAMVRAGATTIIELAVLSKLMLLVPLPVTSSRGEQGANADFMRQHEAALVLPQERLDSEGVTVLSDAWTKESRRVRMVQTAVRLFQRDATVKITHLLTSYVLI